MSETLVVTDPTDVTPAKVTRKRASAKSVPFSNIHVAFGKAKGVDVTRAAKLNRSYIRSNFDDVCRVWPELRTSHKANRDGNRYPQTIPANVADMIVKRNVPTRKTK